MLQRLIDDVKQSTGSALRLTSLAAAAAIALFITLAFLCAAAFVYVLQHYGPVEACLAGAALFLVVTLIVVAVYVAHKREMQRRAEKAAKAAKSAAATMFADPALIATGLQIVRAVGVKRLIPILVVGGLALGLMASRSAASGAEAEEEE
ncbi:hypothetical protein JQ559_28770 [Bradyrhizobium viridifuturi]|jgi:glycerol dehydrogenase-like iron-containing ADH family enzyme|uniref:hypothetical protein n=1 Tax=Bradyrhizobium TaxID=374 RepID=UPI0003960C16|nr:MULTISPECIES: hypothetical protein [Bradyrhizobium]ERF84093.1 MAG: hypothetical protein C207_02536 [Bradyrhizobium sp. DFCI-1]OYU58369.1 MAG: hypothetical protein CFE30_31315 [Bradyrhizobium sp. PARBB1]PSO25240.1 hypothetical protein C7G43_15870 [Bradyrhizobium sp. MOS004]QRI70481.1 hypothetical protein JQ507_02775 [Bradyrhizobium sp. PSBB068]MBR1023267.1 hypothetical protein [Bradyrhizobium viridifuturi]